MKNIKWIALALLSVLLTACTPQISPSPEVPSAHFEPLRYDSREAFHQVIFAAKEGKQINEQAKWAEMAEIDAYYDFQSLMEKLEFDEILVKDTYINVVYKDQIGKESGELLLKCWRPLGEYGDDDGEAYFASYKLDGKSIDLVINGHKVKKQVFYETPDGSGWTLNSNDGKNPPLLNQYFWVEDGTGMFMSVSSCLLEKYPEDAFFDIVKVTPEEWKTAP